MSSTFRAVERSKVYAGIVDQILANIRAGTYPPGSALPAERVLAEQLEVSRGSLREAIRVLEHTGVLDVRVGSGTYVTSDSQSTPTILRAKAAAIGEHSPLDLIEARAAIEPVCAEQAASSRNDGDLEAIQETIVEQREITRQGGDPTEADHSFHLAVAGASHNGVLLALERSLVDLMREGTWTELKHQSRSSRSAAEEYLRQHVLVFEAIQDRDSRRASQMMSMHISAIEVGLRDHLPNQELV